MNKLFFTMIGVLVSAQAFASGGVQTWSQNPNSNNNPPPYGYQTNMLATKVATTGQQVMADVRKWYDSAQWIDDGVSKGYVSPTAFSVTGNLTSVYHANRRVMVSSSTPATVYGTIVSSSYSNPSTTVIIAPDSGTLDSALTRVWFGAVSALNSSVVSSTFGLGDATNWYGFKNVPTQIQAVSNTGSISLTSLQFSGTISGTGNISVSTVSATNIYSQNQITSLLSVATVSVSTVSTTSVNVAAATANINGISSCSLRKNFNISGCTRISAGVYGISFTTPMPDANYAVAGNCQRVSSLELWFEVTDQISSPTTTGFMVRCQSASSPNDSARLNVVVFP